MFSFFFKLGDTKKVNVGDWVTTNQNVYGKYLHCKVIRIYNRFRAWHNYEKFCCLEFELNGVLKRINCTYKSCRHI